MLSFNPKRPEDQKRKDSENLNINTQQPLLKNKFFASMSNFIISINIRGDKYMGKDYLRYSTACVTQPEIFLCFHDYNTVHQNLKAMHKLF